MRYVVYTESHSDHQSELDDARTSVPSRNSNAYGPHPQSGPDPNTQDAAEARTWDRPEYQDASEKEMYMLGEIFGMDGMIVLIVLAVVLFGGAAIPKLARNLGSAKNEFEKGLNTGRRVGPANAPDTSLAESTSTVQPSSSGS